jgi:Peptidase_C39 like family/RTX calcium-binding nonapeptide repeat (4 copies)
MRRMLSRILGSKTTTRRPARPKASLRVEALEQRDLMSVTAATLTNGVLRVTCDSGHDQVEIRETSSGPIILLQNPGAGASALSGNIITVKDLTHATNNTWTFNRSEVQQIEVNLGAGDDRLVSDASVATTVQAGDGNDYVETGPASDLIFAGEGNDTVLAHDGDDLINGGDGKNVMYGQRGNDTIFGGTGNSFLLGGEDNDTLFSVNRNDVVDGGAGTDRLFLLAGGPSVHGGENVTIALDTNQPQTDGFSCGPNSGSRLLRSYGIDASYDALRHKVKAKSLLFKLHLGTRPSVLLNVLRKFKSDLGMETKASLENVLDFLRSGKPVIALVAPTARRLHYVVLNGFDQDSGTIQYVDTNGVKGSWTFAQFEHRWQWTNYFKGIRGRAMRLAVKLAGVETRTFLA